MALLTRHIHMCARQWKITEGVIERRRAPAIHGMTLAAIEPKATFMRLVVLMARITVLHGHREIAQTARINMALHAGKTDVLACYFERENIVIEVFIETIHPIMAFETG